MLDNLCREGELDAQTRDRANAVLAMKTGLKRDSIFIYIRHDMSLLYPTKRAIYVADDT